MRLGGRPQGNLTTGATGPFSSLTGQTSSDCRENSLYKDNSFHSSAQFSQILIFFPSLSFPSKKLFGKDVFLFKRRLMTLLLTIDIFLFILHCLPATRCSLNILPLEDRTSEINPETEMDEQLIQGVAVEEWKKKWFSQV